MITENNKQFKLRIPNILQVSYKDNNKRFRANVSNDTGEVLTELFDGGEPWEISTNDVATSCLSVSFVNHNSKEVVFRLAEIEVADSKVRPGLKEVKIHFEVGDPDTVVMTIIIDEGPSGNK